MAEPKARFSDGTMTLSFGHDSPATWTDKVQSHSLTERPGNNKHSGVGGGNSEISAVHQSAEDGHHESGGGGGGSHGVQSQHKTSYFETIIHIFKGNVGPGVLALGEAFKNGGLFLSPVLTLILGIICVHCQHVLLNCSALMRDRLKLAEYPDYARTVELCFETGPTQYRKFARPMRVAINWFLCVTQLGFCCVYIVFVPKNTMQVLQQYGVEVDEKIIMTLVLVPIVLSCLLTNLKYLSYCSLVASASMLGGCAITLYYIFVDLPSPSERHSVGEIQNLPLFFGTAIFAFEGIALVLPLQNAMKKPADFARPAGVLNVGMVVVTSLFLIIGFFGYLKYGDEIESSISLNLPSEDVLAQAVKIVFAIGVLLGFALQFYIAIDIMWPSLVERFQWQQNLLFKELLFRTLMVFVTFCVAISVPNLGILISLIGAFASTSLALVFPIVIELAVHAEEKEPKISPWLWIKSVLIFLLAGLGCFLGTYENIVNIIRIYSEQK